MRWARSPALSSTSKRFGESSGMDAAIFCAPETGGHKLYPRATGESLLPGNSLLPPSRAYVTENHTRLTRHSDRDLPGAVTRANIRTFDE